MLDDENKLLGVITAQNIIEASDDEMGEDYAKLGGLSAEEDLNEPVLASVKKRLPWLLILLGLGMVVSRAVACCNYPCSCGSLLRHKLDIPAERPPSLIKIHAKKDPHCKKYGSIFYMVRPVRFERMAYRVGVCHSIQLSYGRICGAFAPLFYYLILEPQGRS